MSELSWTLPQRTHRTSRKTHFRPVPWNETPTARHVKEPTRSTRAIASVRDETAQRRQKRKGLLRPWNRRRSARFPEMRSPSFLQFRVSELLSDAFPHRAPDHPRYRRLRSRNRTPETSSPRTVFAQRPGPDFLPGLSPTQNSGDSISSTFTCPLSSSGAAPRTWDFPSASTIVLIRSLRRANTATGISRPRNGAVSQACAPRTLEI